MKKEKKVEEKDKHELYIRNIFAKNLKKFRSDRHMSQMELSSISNLSCNFINEIENEKKWPSIESLAKLVKALGVEPYDLFSPEIMLKTNQAEMLKTKLSGLITTVVNESIDQNAIFVSETGKDKSKT